MATIETASDAAWTPPPPRWRPFHREVQEWAMDTGPRTNATAWAIAVLLASHVEDPQTGEVVMTQEEIADRIGCTRQTVGSWTDKLATQVLVNGRPFLSRELMPRDEKGKYPYYLYTLNGVHDGWQVVEPKGEHSMFKSKSELLEEERRLREESDSKLDRAERKLERALAQLAAAGLEVDLDEDFDTDTREENIDSVHVKKFNMDRGSPPPDAKDPDQLENSSLPTATVGVKKSRREEVSAFVDAHLDEVVGEKPGQIYAGRRKAVELLMAPGELERWQKKVAAANPGIPGDSEELKERSRTFTRRKMQARELLGGAFDPDAFARGEYDQLLDRGKGNDAPRRE